MAASRLAELSVYTFPFLVQLQSPKRPPWHCTQREQEETLTEDASQKRMMSALRPDEVPLRPVPLLAPRGVIGCLDAAMCIIRARTHKNARK